MEQTATMFAGNVFLQRCVSQWKTAPPVKAAGLFRSGVRRVVGAVAKLRAAFSLKVPVGYEDETGFNYGATPVPPVKKTCHPVLAFAVFGGLLATVPFQAFASQSLQTLTLAWNASSSPAVAGYTIYYGSQLGSYPNKISVGNVTNATISGLNLSVRNYFVVTARDTLGLESLPSNQVSYVIPSLFSLAMQMVQGNPAAVIITSTGATPANWVLESSSNMTTWTTAATGTNASVSVTMTVAGTPTRFFRLRD